MAEAGGRAEGSSLARARVPPLAAAVGDARHVRVTGTLVRCDLTGFTTLTERLALGGREGAELLASAIDGLFSALITAAGGLGGSLLTFGGDSLTILFDGDDDLHRAVRAAGLLQRRIAGPGGRIEVVGRPVRMRMTVGVHRGEVDVVVVGDRHRDLLLAGPDVAVAVATEAAAPPGRIAVSPGTAVLLPVGAVGADGLLRRVPTGPGDDVAPGPPPPAGLDPTPWIPLALRPLLAAGEEVVAHRWAASGFVRAAGFDALLADVGPDEAGRCLHDAVTSLQGALDDVGAEWINSDVAAGGPVVTVAAGVLRAGPTEEALVDALAAVVDAADPVLGLRASVASGPVFVGHVGPPWRRLVAIHGDAVNGAARIAAALPGPGLGVEAAVADRLVRRRRVVDRFTFRPRGRSASTTVAVLGEVTGERRRADGDGPLVGRDGLVADVVAALDAGAGAVALVGEAGAGKTRVASAAVDAWRARHPGAVVRRVTAVPADRLAPGTVLAALAPLVGGDDGLLVVVDDVHDADPTSVEALAAAAVDGDATVLLVGRSAPALDPAGLAGVLEVARLGDADVASVVRSVLGADGSPPVVADVVARAAGSPLAATLLAGQRRTAAGAAVGDAGPVALEHLAGARIDAAPPLAARLVRELSVLGPDVDVHDAAHLLEVPDDALDAVLGGQRHLLAREGDRWRYDHPTTAEAAWASLPRARRRALHARALARGAATGAPVGRLVHHAHHARLPAEVWRLGAPALRDLGRATTLDALELGRVVAAALDRLPPPGGPDAPGDVDVQDVLEITAEATVLLPPAEVWPELRRLWGIARARLAHDDRRLASVGEIVARLGAVTGHPAGALAVATRLLRGIAADDPSRAHLHVWCSAAHQVLGNERAALAHAEAARAAAGPDDLRGRTLAVVVLGAMLVRDDADRVRAMVEPVLVEVVAQEPGSPLRDVVEATLAATLRRRGDVRRALEVVASLRSRGCSWRLWLELGPHLLEHVAVSGRHELVAELWDPVAPHVVDLVDERDRSLLAGQLLLARTLGGASADHLGALAASLPEPDGPERLAAVAHLVAGRPAEAEQVGAPGGWGTLATGLARLERGDVDGALAAADELRTAVAAPDAGPWDALLALLGCRLRLAAVPGPLDAEVRGLVADLDLRAHPRIPGLADVAVVDGPDPLAAGGR